MLEFSGSKQRVRFYCHYYNYFYCRCVSFFFNTGNREFATYLKHFLQHGPEDLDVDTIFEHIQTILGGSPLVLLVDELFRLPEGMNEVEKNHIAYIKEQLVYCLRHLHGNRLLKVSVVANVLNLIELEAIANSATELNYVRTNSVCENALQLFSLFSFRF